MSEQIEKSIDIKKVLQGKMGARARFVPGFAVSWLKHIVHEDYVNEFLWQARDLEGSDWLESCMNFLDVKLDVHGRENLPSPQSGQLCTFVSNHPLGAIDGVGLGMLLGRFYDDNFRYLANDLLMNMPGLKKLCIPINKTGKLGRDFPQMVERGFAGSTHILMFPAGLCSRQIDGRIQDIPWKKTFISKSVETHRDIVPIHFEGQNSPRFYRIANWCKRLGLKFNLAMLFLADEMYRGQHQTYRVTIGKPIPWQTFDHSKSPMEWAKIVRDGVYEL
ncbi:MAG: glycerol acyltransferase [Prevotella sp.]|nr:glycerol acyltransferase [Prevotella sp.]